MKRLSILRHAHAAPARPSGDDIARPLSERGREEAARMAVHMRERGILPDRVLCSTAARTRETLEPFLPLLPEKAGIVYAERLYNAPFTDLLEALQEAPDDALHILVVGHNPGLHHLAIELIDPSLADALGLRRIAEDFPPGALARLDFNLAHWAGVRAARGALISFTTPDELTGRDVA